MKTLVSIYDKVSMQYSKPLVFENNNTSKRYFSNLVCRNPYKDDFELYKIGEFSFDNGKINVIDKELIIKGDEVPFVGVPEDTSSEDNE